MSTSLFRYIFLALCLVAGGAVAGPPKDGVVVPEWGQQGGTVGKFADVDFAPTQDMIQLDDGSSLIAVESLQGVDQRFVGFVRLDPDGKRDQSFGTNGSLKTSTQIRYDNNDQRLHLVRTALNSVFIAGADTDPAHGVFVCRIDPATGATIPFAAMKPACVTVGGPQALPMALLAQADGKLLVISAPRVEQNGIYSVTRLTTDGSKDVYGTGGEVKLPPMEAGALPVLRTARVASNGKLVLAVLDNGNNYSRLYRLTSAGTVDMSWNPTAQLLGYDNFTIYALLTEKRPSSPEDDVVVQGSAAMDESSTGFLVRISGDTGQLDPEFGDTNVDSELIGSAELLPRPGGGYFGLVGAGLPVKYAAGLTTFTVFALEQNGALDQNFATDGFFYFNMPFAQRTYASAMTLRNGSVYAAGGAIDANNQTVWFELNLLGNDRIFADDFELIQDGG